MRSNQIIKNLNKISFSQTNYRLPKNLLTRRISVSSLTKNTKHFSPYQNYKLNIKKFSIFKFSTYSDHFPHPIFYDERLLETYKKIESIVIDASEKAKMMNKKLLLLVGETHIDREPLVLQTMLIHIAHRQGIRNILAEMPPGASDQIDEFVDNPDFMISPNLAFSLKMARDQLGMKITEADVDYDDDFDSLEKLMTIRDKHFSKKCLMTNEDTIFIMGFCHLHGVLTTIQASDTPYHAIAINFEGNQIINDVSEPSDPLELRIALNAIANKCRDKTKIEQISTPKFDWNTLHPKQIILGVEKTVSNALMNKNSRYCLR